MTIMDEQDVGESPATASRRRITRLRVVLGVTVVVLLVAGAVVGVAAYRHHARYADAPALRVRGGEFYPITGGPGGQRTVQIGSVNVAEIQVRRNTDQGFVIWVRNPSSVTQTIVGTTPTGETVEHNHVLVSTTDPSRGTGDVRFSAHPTAVPPGQYRAVRYLWRTTACWGEGKAETYTSLQLRVQVGGTILTEIIPITSLITVVIDARHASC